MPTQGRPSLVVPVNTLLFRAEGPRIAVVGDDSKAHLKPVRIGRDYGEKVEITDGLAANDKVILNPADALLDGQPVTVVQPNTEPPSGPGASTQNQSGASGSAGKGQDGDDKGRAKPQSLKDKTTSK